MGGEDLIDGTENFFQCFGNVLLALLFALFNRTVFASFTFTLFEFALVIASKDEEEEQNEKY